MDRFEGTRGPWKVRSSTIGSVGTENKLVHICMEPIDPYLGMDGEDKANMNLIAAAPELLEALQKMVESYQFEASIDNPALLQARAAIAKALGK